MMTTPDPMTSAATLIGGPYDHRGVTLTKTPPRILVGGVEYTRLDDPETGEFLGGYFHREETADA